METERYPRPRAPASAEAPRARVKLHLAPPRNRGVPELERNPLPLALIQSTDHELVLLARNGSEKAFRELLDRYQRPVFSLVYRMVRDRERAEDLAQETFIKVFNHLERYDPKYKFSSWIFKIASNLAIDQLRKKEPETVSLEGSRHASTAEQQEATRIQIESRDENPEESLEAKELGAGIEHAVGQLRPEYRTAIILRHVEGRPYEEIAQIMDVPLGTVKTYIRRARLELRETLAPLRY
jgi:RNA polymerase sigma-70 factor (ECF subfamily)